MSNILNINENRKTYFSGLTNLEVCKLHINNYFSVSQGNNVYQLPNTCKNNAALRRLILNLEATYHPVTVELALRSLKKYKIVQNMLKSA